MCVIVLQRRFGPRWFVPWICLPHVYNYYRVVLPDEEHGAPECVICMNEIDLAAPERYALLVGYLKLTES